MAPQLSGSPLVPVSESVNATNIRTQDYFMNPPATGWTFDVRAGISLNSKDTTPTSGSVTAGMGSLNITNAFTTSGRTITAAGSGVFAPLGYFAVQVSGSTVVVPYFTP